jgi:hypothetical protein
MCVYSCNVKSHELWIWKTMQSNSFGGGKLIIVRTLYSPIVGRKLCYSSLLELEIILFNYLVEEKYYYFL